MSYLSDVAFMLKTTYLGLLSCDEVAELHTITWYISYSQSHDHYEFSTVCQRMTVWREEYTAE